MNYDHNKNVGLLQFHSGYGKFNLNSPKGYSLEIINAQTGRVVIDARGGLAQYLLKLVCDFQRVTLLFVKCHAPPTDIQTFKFQK